MQKEDLEINKYLSENNLLELLLEVEF